MLDLNGPPTCPDCGGQLSEGVEDHEEGRAYTYDCPACSWEDDGGYDYGRLTLLTAPWTRRLAEELLEARARQWAIDQLGGGRGVQPPVPAGWTWSNDVLSRSWDASDGAPPIDVEFSIESVGRVESYVWNIAEMNADNEWEWLEDGEDGWEGPSVSEAPFLLQAIRDAEAAVEARREWWATRLSKASP